MAKVKRRKKPVELKLSSEVLRPKLLPIGLKQYRLTLVSDGTNLESYRLYTAICNCGNSTLITGGQWLRAEKRSCGECKAVKVNRKDDEHQTGDETGIIVSDSIEQDIEQIIESNIKTENKSNSKTNNFNIYEIGKNRSKNKYGIK